jgi:hypothetical protein
MKKNPYNNSLKFSSLEFNVFIVENDVLRVHWIELPINAREDKKSFKIYITKAKFVVCTSNVGEEVWIRDG